ncbi:MAG: ABC transporter substrate-binding protein, partial [Rhodospirillales bacterium]
MKFLPILLVTSMLSVLLGRTGFADDLDDVLARGEIRHLGINYANFVTGSG